MGRNLSANLRNVDIEKLDDEYEVTRYINKHEKKSISKRLSKLGKQRTSDLGTTKQFSKGRRKGGSREEFSREY